MTRTRFAALVVLAAAVAVALWPAGTDAATARADSTIKVTVPQDDAEVKLNGTVVKGTGTTRELKIADLKDGQEYKYTVSAMWAPNNYTKITRTRTVAVVGGKAAAVDLTKVDPKQPDDVVVRWVPTPQDIVEKMIDLAGVTKDDVVYEPGPGDGRMLITAAQKGAKKCVGIEFDEKKTLEAQAAVKRAKLEDRVSIRQGDALKVKDYGDATVILLYMGEQFNLALKPLFDAQCKPGTRIVSHRFRMGDWAPDKTIHVKGLDGDDYELHLWVIKGKK